MHDALTVQVLEADQQLGEVAVNTLIDNNVDLFIREYNINKYASQGRYTWHNKL